MEVYQYPEDYQCSVIGNQDWQDAMIITNGALWLMNKWMANRIYGGEILHEPRF
jgi:hypothetical protein